jgi:hypothetical protein
MRLHPWLAPVVLAVSLARCGGSVSDPGGLGNPPPDSGTPHTDAGAPGQVVGPCGAGGTCAAGSTCYFPIGSCDAAGECVANPAPGTPECGAIELLCGCGEQAYSGCGFPEGFASAPTTGESASCMEVTPPLDAGPVPDATEPGGPCSSNADCAAGDGCYYAIGSCPGQGECVPVPTGPGCGAEESLCGCDGSQVTSGCGFPSGYASGPTDGSSFCTSFDAGPPDAGTDSGTDAGFDAGGSCAALADCCPALPASSYASCKAVVTAGNDADCASQLAAVEAAGYCG